MRLPDRLTQQLIRWTDQVRIHRAPDFRVGEHYLARWYLTPWAGKYRTVEQPTRWQRIVRSLPVLYCHAFFASDDDRALHDHPAASITLVLDGGYWEHVPADPDNPAGPTVAHYRQAGDIVIRRAHAPHRIELPRGVDRCITLFAFGLRLRRNEKGERDPRWWGFWCPHGWRHWRKFTDPNDSGQTGRGCD